MLDEEVVGGDETTENINGVLKWLWTWRSERLTYLAGGKGRGPKDFDSEYPDGFPKSTFVSDRLPLYYNVVAQGHQICIAHLLRNLILMDTAKKNGQSAFNVIRAIAYPKAIADGVYLQF